MTQEEIIYSIANPLNKSDDLSFLRRLKKQVDYYRETFFIQDYRRGRKLIKSYLQEIPYIPMEIVDISGLGTFNIGKKILRSKRKLPRIVNLDHGFAIKYIGTIDYGREFSVVDINSFKYQEYSRYSKKAPICFFKDDYLYVANAKPDALAIEAMFSNPTDLGEWKTKEGEQLYKFGDQYPISGQMIQRIIQSILNIELNILMDDSEIKADETKNTQTEGTVQ